MKHKMIVVVVLNWNGYLDTLACMDSLACQTYPSFRVILVDNGSESEEKQKLELHYRARHGVELIQFEHNLGFTKANNLIAERLLEDDECDYIALLNNDTTVDEAWLTELVKCAEETHSDIVGSKLVFMDDPSVIDNVGHFMLNTGEILPLGNGDKENRYQQRMPIFGACAGAMLINKKLIHEIGLFDPFFETGYEDAEFGARACLLGHRCTFEPKAVVKHRGSASLVKIRDYEYLIRLEVNVWYTYVKLMPALLLWLNLPFILLKYVLIVSGTLLSGRSRIAKIYSVALYRVVSSYRTQLQNSRREFWDNYQIPMLRAAKSQRFFVSQYNSYFWKYVIQGRRSIFD